MTWVLYLIIACGALSIAYGVVTTKAVLASDAGTPRMQEIAAAIQEGAQGLSRPPIHHDRHRRRGHLCRHWLICLASRRRSASPSALSCPAPPVISA